MKTLILNRVLKQENVTFALIQYKQPVKYVSISNTLPVTAVHSYFSKLVDTHAIIRDVVLANETHMKHIPISSVTLPIREFLAINTDSVSISFHYKYGFVVHIYFIDQHCIDNLENKKKTQEIELAKIYPSITDEKRHKYVNKIVNRICIK
jgi:hypothetical protein